MKKIMSKVLICIQAVCLYVFLFSGTEIFDRMNTKLEDFNAIINLFFPSITSCAALFVISGGVQRNDSF